MGRRVLRWLALAALSYGVACGRGDRRVEAPLASLPAAGAPVGVPASVSGGPRQPTLEGVPDDIPVDIPVPAGLHPTSISSTEPGSLVALFTGDLDPEDVARQFGDTLRGAGWMIDQSRSTGTDLGLLAHKDQRMASVVVTRLDGKLHVELGVWSPP